MRYNVYRFGNAIIKTCLRYRQGDETLLHSLLWTFLTWGVMGNSYFKCMTNLVISQTYCEDHIISILWLGNAGSFIAPSGSYVKKRFYGWPGTYLFNQALIKFFTFHLEREVNTEKSSDALKLIPQRLVRMEWMSGPNLNTNLKFEWYTIRKVPYLWQPRVILDIGC